jgi:predicted ABC-type ATPase
MSDRRVLIIAGPNGAGKTTFARAFLPREANCPRFINADLIAAGLSPFEPEAAAVRAGRLMLQELDDCIARGKSFAFETTLAGRAYLRHITAWRAAGWHVSVAGCRLARNTVLPGASERRSRNCPGRRPCAPGRP